MNSRSMFVALLTTLLVTLLPPLSCAYAANVEKIVDLQNGEMDFALFRRLANNSYFAVYFNALPADSAENVEVETHAF